MDEDPSHKESWFRRPRRPLPGFFDYLLLWLLAIFWLGVAFLVGLGVVATEDDGRVKAGGFLAILLSSAVLVWFVAYWRRPVAQHDPRAKSAIDRATADSWAGTLARHGHVEVALSKRKVARAFAQIMLMLLLAGFLVFGVADAVAVVGGIVVLAMAVFLALLPHLEVATAGRPALRVDSHGIEIARWFRLKIPWTQVLGVQAHASTKSMTNVVVAVDDEFFGRYQGSRPFPLRITDAVYSIFVGCGFAIPATIVADPEALAVWLDREARRRNPDVDHPARHRRVDTDDAK